MLSYGARPRRGKGAAEATRRSRCRTSRRPAVVEAALAGRGRGCAPAAPAGHSTRSSRCRTSPEHGKGTPGWAHKQCCYANDAWVGDPGWGCPASPGRTRGGLFPPPGGVGPAEGTFRKLSENKEGFAPPGGRRLSTLCGHSHRSDAPANPLKGRFCISETFPRDFLVGGTLQILIYAYPQALQKRNYSHTAHSCIFPDMRLNRNRS
jgi:hypothetical protein